MGLELTFSPQFLRDSDWHDMSSTTQSPSHRMSGFNPVVNSPVLSLPPLALSQQTPLFISYRPQTLHVTIIST